MADTQTLLEQIEFLNARIEALEKELVRVNSLVAQAKEILTPLLKEVEYEKCKTYFKAKNAEIKWESDNGMKVKHNGKTFDLVKKYFETPQATIDNFDFTVSMFAVDNEKVYYGETTFIDLAKRQLMLNKIPYPASTMSRAFRYYGKGFKMCLGEMKKLCEAIQAMPKEEKQDENGNTVTPPSGDDVTDFFIGID